VYLDDDRMCAHLTYNHLQAWVDFWEGPREAPAKLEGAETRYWPGARFYRYEDPRRFAVVSAAKGGVLRIYLDSELACMDNGLIAKDDRGTVHVSHLIDRYEVQELGDGIRVEGSMGVTRFRLPSPAAQSVFHLGMAAVGRWASDLIRALLQRILIVGKRPSPLKFRRTLKIPPNPPLEKGGGKGESFSKRDAAALDGEPALGLVEESPPRKEHEGSQSPPFLKGGLGGFILVDELWHEGDPQKRPRLEALYAGTDHTSIYVAVSNSYHRGCLDPWVDYAPYLEAFHTKGYIRIERTIQR
jgi:hypothetical protein